MIKRTIVTVKWLYYTQLNMFIFDEIMKLRKGQIFTENLKPIARSIRQFRGLRFSRKEKEAILMQQRSFI